MLEPLLTLLILLDNRQGSFSFLSELTNYLTAQFSVGIKEELEVFKVRAT